MLEHICRLTLSEGGNLEDHITEMLDLLSELRLLRSKLMTIIGKLIEEYNRRKGVEDFSVYVERDRCFLCT